MNFLVTALRQGITHLRTHILHTEVPSSTPYLSKNLLQPVSPLLSLVNGFKMKRVVKRRCRDCYMAAYGGRVYNFCKTHQRHKVMSLKKHEKKWRILTWAGQSKIRPW